MTWVGAGKYYEVEPDGLKMKTVAGGNGKYFFTPSQLREAYPAIAEEAIAYMATGPRGDFCQVVIDQVHDNIVRLRGRYNDNGGHGCKLLHGKTLGWDRKDWGRQYLHLNGPLTVVSIPAPRDERGKLLSNEELQERHRMAMAKGEPLRWKKVWVSEREPQYRIDDGKDDRTSRA
ncbi:hypothetical protein A1Q2_06987 [Trichosporon asahii var. asahii CBS 8904]|uniref:Uncharacterized protein n=1 Tax=Trichosporon asahii var. asahii (strain CBS 8904) TaxID=1220162 RepID=K1VD91_TRIAC|nr:hypothetical protein A1Q2_06987 [Trichosporon asahii var. asahii CBS 8904]